MDRASTVVSPTSSAPEPKSFPSRRTGKTIFRNVATVARRWPGNSPRPGDRSYVRNTEVILPAFFSVSNRLGFVAICCAALAVQTANATPPRVSFDIDPLVACRDVTPPDFAEANPDERLVQADVEVSSLIRYGCEGDLIQYFYRVESPEETIRIVDYSPKTTMASDVAGNISIEKKKEKTNHIGMALTGPIDWPIRATGSGDLGNKSGNVERYELVPQSFAVAASGTVRRGYGVYFKLKPSRSTTLEGSREFTLVFRVPKEWRGDYIHLSCTAVGLRRGVVAPLNERTVCGARRFVVALYADGDTSAKLAAERLARAEAGLLKTVVENHREIEKQFYPTFVHRLGAMLDVIEPPVPDDWAQRLIYGTQETGIADIAERLPTDVREAVDEYAIAKRELFQMGTPEASEVQ